MFLRLSVRPSVRPSHHSVIRYGRSRFENVNKTKQFSTEFTAYANYAKQKLFVNFLSIIYHGSVNTNYRKIIIIRVFKMCKYSHSLRGINGRVDTKNTFLLYISVFCFVFFYILMPINNYSQACCRSMNM